MRKLSSSEGDERFMQTMNAVCLAGPGGNPELMEVPIPEIDANEVLVRMRAIGVGLHDRYTNPGNVTFPYPIGVEGSGVVEAVGGAVTEFQTGDRVMITGMHPKGGTWAEFAAINAHMLMPMPEGLSFQESAALPVAGATALEGVKALHLGAELTVDYRDPNCADQVKNWMPGGLDAALAIQRGTGQTSLAAVRDGGGVVTISGDQVRTERNIGVAQMMHNADTRPEFLQMASDVASGRMRVVIEQVYPLEEAMAALEKTETGHARGKIIVTIGDN